MIDTWHINIGYSSFLASDSTDIILWNEGQTFNCVETVIEYINTMEYFMYFEQY